MAFYVKFELFNEVRQKQITTYMHMVLEQQVVSHENLIPGSELRLFFGSCTLYIYIIFVVSIY